ncbi:cytochrome P450 [Thelephora ganbajun]|uniref:Cytochrome P450 n=1 Tax=Thelephora ganbajun TaxID=370292 RepID=A0ACB6ZS56_THEGA|nr:cytochrome P450 [Thelephora ganbajun]
MVKIAEQAMEGFALASEPSAFMVDNFPFLKHMPEWLPGGGFKKKAREMFEDRERLYEVPFKFVREQIESQLARRCFLLLTPVIGKGQGLRSFVSASLETRGDPEREELIKAAAASLYSGGIDTTPSSLSAFVLAMALHPHVQARAQAELNKVLGLSFERLPCFADRPKMPYINAVVREILRWNPAVPLGLAHRLASDDSYRGYFLPEGLVVWANIWTMTRDQGLYPSPDIFDPERFLDDEGNLGSSGTDNIPFGFGRRICPGLYFAENSIWIAVATILYCFEIKKTKDANGVEIEPVVDFDGFVSHPKPFKCDIKPRLEAAKALLHEKITHDE